MCAQKMTISFVLCPCNATSDRTGLQRFDQFAGIFPLARLLQREGQEFPITPTAAIAAGRSGFPPNDATGLMTI
ncbi:MAG: hypothetical protein C0617_14175 [Desulfuromonas sp.]|nr:MAG: hypothetical protein C0617_14175 [Desulfuromonas sp.]